MLDLKALLLKMLGCSYTSGTSNNWWYKKYADGTFEAEIRDTTNLSIASATGSMYYSASRVVNLPDIGVNYIRSASSMYVGAESTFAKLNSWSYGSPGTISYTLLSSSSRTASSRVTAIKICGTWA